MLFVVVCFITALVALYHSLKPRPLPGIPVGYPPGYKHIPWLIGFLGLAGDHIERTGYATMLFDAIAAESGPVVQVLLGPANTWLGRLGFGKTLILVSDAQGIEEAAIKKASTFNRSFEEQQAFHLVMPYGMFPLPNGNHHRHQRRMLGPSMSTEFLTSIEPRLNECLDELVHIWKTRANLAKAASEGAFDAKEDLSFFTRDVIASIAFGKTFDGLRNVSKHLSESPSPAPSSFPPLSTFSQHFTYMLNQVATNFQMGPFASLHTLYCRHFSKDFRAARYETVAFIKQVIKGEREMMESQDLDLGEKRAVETGHVLRMLLHGESTDKEKGKDALTENEIIDALIGFLIGGEETVATTLCWFLKYLTSHPEAQSKVRTELLSVYPFLHTSDPSRRPLTLSELNNEASLPYFTATVHELVRLARTTEGVVRTADQATNVLGYPIPKGALLLFLSTAVKGDGIAKEHSDQMEKEGRKEPGLRKYGWWKEDTVTELMPERWLDADGRFDGKSGPWQMFGLGPRGCFGQKLAVCLKGCHDFSTACVLTRSSESPQMLELKACVARFLTEFFFEPVPVGMDNMDFRFTLTRQPNQVGVNLVPLYAEAL